MLSKQLLSGKLDAGSIPGSKRYLEEEMATHPSILMWASHRWRSLVGYSPWGLKGSGMTKWLNSRSRLFVESIPGILCRRIPNIEAVIVST